MSNGLVVPGVQVTVVKEVLPQQAAPSGVLGIIGFTEKRPARVERASSFSRLLDVFGRATAHSLPEARLALDNGVYELVVSPLDENAGVAAHATITGDTEAPGNTPGPGFGLVLRANGPWGNGLRVVVSYRPSISPGSRSFDLVIQRPTASPEVLERHRDLTKDNLAATLLRDSALVTVDGSKPVGWPAAGEYAFGGGQDAGPADYAKAIAKLRDEPDVDMVLAAVQDFSDRAKLAKIYGDVISHCNLMAGECKGRIGFGQVPSTGATADHVDLAQNLVSDRFVLAPNGVVGAVAGLVGSMPYFQSPTFKRVSGLGELAAIGIEDQRKLLTGHVVPIALERSMGIIVLRGLTTDGDQISVRRVADRAVRLMKGTGDKFIGLLNNADGRAALRSKLVEGLTQMEKDGALVPSTDGVDPAFKVNVYSSQADFALGIVRVDMAVRPVRAIDYIYATITIQV